MTQQSGSQFEDDLTMGMGEEESFTTDSIDLLGIGGDSNSPIARLKTIILSIDWEINDDILQQLDDELHDLSEVWASDKIKQVYVQGLSKIGRYIYKEKAGAHPNSIKLLITFYHNLEKIVTNEDSMSEDEKKQLLLADVKKFDQLKSQIGKPKESAGTSKPATVTVANEETAPVAGFSNDPAAVTELKTLKALVLGIDWEINDREINKLGSEVKRLESVFSQSKAKLILLQGIGALSSYINKKRSQSNSDAFSLLHSFYDSLETISGSNLSPAEEKTLLLAEVSKFNAFKAIISSEKTNQSRVVSDAGSTIEFAEPSSESPAALSDSPASFSGDAPAQEVKEDSVDDAAVAADVTSRLSSVFGEEDEQTKDDSYKDSDKNEALEGVNVETEADDESGEEALPYQDGNVAPALTDVDEDSSFSVEKLADDLSVAPPTKMVEAIVGDDIEEEEEFSLDDVDEPLSDVVGEEVTAEVTESEDVLPGVDVETDADDDSEEEDLPMESGELAPALSGAADGSGFNADNLVSEFDKSDTDAIEDRLGSFFDDEVASSSEGWVSETAVLPDMESADLGSDGDDVVAALSDIDEESPETEDAYDETTEQEGIVVEDDLEPALFESELETLPETPESEKESDESAEAFVEDGLSFLDDEIDESPEEILIEEDETESNAGESLSFLDDDTASFNDLDDSVIKETAVEQQFQTDEAESVVHRTESDSDSIPAVESVEETTDEEAFDFFDDVEESVEESFDDTTDEIAFEVEAEDLEEDDEIEFTVPGEDLADGIEGIPETDEPDEKIEFAIPGEISTSAADVLAAAAVATVSETVSHGSAEIVADNEDAEVVFDAVADDVELDLLPGEVFDDSVTVEDESGADGSSDELVEFTPVDEGRDTGRYESLGILVAALQNNVADDCIHDLLSEINKLRISQDTSYSDKTFLQLLSTATQFVDKNRDASKGFELMTEIVYGLEMSDSSEQSKDSVQEKLFTCTSQILLLQTNEKFTTVVVSEKVIDPETEVESAEIAEETTHEEIEEETINYALTGQEEQLASFVQKELADIRKLFVDEIGSLRKELAENKS